MRTRLKFNILFLILCNFIFLNCSKDSDSSEEVSETSLVGTWTLTQEIDFFEGERETYNVPSGCDQVLVTFSETTVQTKEDDDCDGILDDEFEKQNYTLTGNTITVNGESALIEKLTSSELRTRTDIIDESEYYIQVFRKK